MPAIATRIPTEYRRIFDIHLPGYDPIQTGDGFEFHAERADRAIRFIETKITHIEGPSAGKPFLLPDWQKAVIACVYGWYDPSTQGRRYLEVFQYVPRGNGKTTQLGAITHLMGLCDPSPAGQLYSAASDKKTAALIYRQARLMALASPAIKKRIKIRDSYKSIEYPGNTVYLVLSADAHLQHGHNPSFIAIDELHAQATANLVNTLTSGAGKRTDPLIWYITTADEDRPSVCNDKLEYAIKVRDGLVSDPNFLPVLYYADREDDWTSQETWAKANPNLGISIPIAYMKRACQKAQDQPTFETTFKQLHLNMKVQSWQKWIDLAYWDKCGGSIDDLDLAEYPSWGGLDIGATSDLTSFCQMFAIDGLYVARWMHWCPEDTIKRRARVDGAPYDVWAREGFLIPTPGNETDYDQVEKDIVRACEEWGTFRIGADRYFQGAQLCQRLKETYGLDVTMQGMGYASMAAPTAELDRLINRGEFRHGDNPVLRWMAGHVVVRTEPSTQALKPDKEKSNEKIDGIVSGIIALGLLMVDCELTGNDDGTVQEVTDDDDADW